MQSDEPQVRSRPLRAVCAPLLLCGLATVTSAQADLSHVVTFGDSMTHNDLLWILSGVPQDVYGADPMEAMFDKGKAPGDELSNYAVGGSLSDDLDAQLAAYFLELALGQVEAATLFGLEIGANDIRDERFLLASAAPQTNPAADAVIDRVIDAIDDAVALVSAGGADIVLWTAPNITLAPDHATEFDPQGADNVRRHTRRLNSFIRSLAVLPQVAVFDLDRHTRILVPHPPTLFGHTLVTSPFYGDYDHIFADGIHLSAATNAILANGIIRALDAAFGSSIPTYTREEIADLAHIPHP